MEQFPSTSRIEAPPLPAAAPVVGLLGPNSGQRWIACAAALVGVLLTGLTCWLIPIPVKGLPIMMGAVGSVSVLLYVVPSSPFAQPWAVIGGNVVSALVGVLAAYLIPQPIVAAAVAVSGAILAMSLLRCVHPPGGASALAGVMGGPALAAAGFAYPAVLFLDCVILVGVACVVHLVTGQRYPARSAPAAVPTPVPISKTVPIPMASMSPATLEHLARQARPLSSSQPATGATSMASSKSSTLDNLRLSVKVTILTALSLVSLSIITFGVTWHIMQSSAESRAVERQEANIRVAWDVIGQYGKGFSLKGGALMIGNRSLNGFLEPVDRIKTLVGGTATLFANDTRVTTNVKNPDGSRAIGTALTSQEVRDAVLSRGESYRGRADIMGRSFFTAYDPIKDSAGKVIGILYVGIPAADFMADVETAVWRIAITGALVTLGAGLLCLLLTGRLFAPLDRICVLMGELAQGNNNIAVDGMGRGDEIGTISRAVGVFRDMAVAKQIADAAQQSVVNDLADRLGRLANGDLTTRLDGAFPEDYVQIQTDFNAAVSALDEAMGAISLHSGDIQQAVLELSRASDDMARSAEQNAANIEEASAALDDATAKVQETASQTSEASRVIATVTSETAAGSGIVRDAVAAMSEIEQSSAKISSITGIIDGLAFQTNLLALNAGVEAARAGSVGAGFAVVAAEVRALAKRSADAARDIKELIAISSKQVKAGAGLVDKTGDALSKIAGEVHAIESLVSNISGSTVLQANGLGVVNGSIGDISAMTQRSAANFEENNAVTQTLASDATTLNSLVGRFQISDPDGQGVTHGANHGHHTDADWDRMAA